jgi:hypothetical protein
MVRGAMAAVTDRVKLAFAVSAGEPASVTVMMMGKLPVVEGVPEMSPLCLSLRPAGRPVTDQV